MENIVNVLSQVEVFDKEIPSPHTCFYFVLKVWFVHKYWLEHLVVIWVKTEMKHNWFIVVQSSLTYIHYLDQPS